MWIGGPFARSGLTNPDPCDHEGMMPCWHHSTRDKSTSYRSWQALLDQALPGSTSHSHSEGWPEPGQRRPPRRCPGPHIGGCLQQCAEVDLGRRSLIAVGDSGAATRTARGSCHGRRARSHGPVSAWPRLTNGRSQGVGVRLTKFWVQPRRPLPRMLREARRTVDLGFKILLGVVVVGVAIAAARVITAAARRASRRRRAAAAHGLGDEQRRHAYADQLADAQIHAGRGGNLGSFARGPLPWQEQRR